MKTNPTPINASDPPRLIDNKSPILNVNTVGPVTKFANAGARDQAESKLKEILEHVNSPLYSVEQRIHAQAREFDPAIEGYIAYATSSQGKRLRPALALISAKATGALNQQHIELAMIIELIHLATLIHDDIMDGAELRRARPTANAKWGNAISVLLGDCMFAHALMLATNFNDRELTRRIAAAANEVCTGEIIQTQRRFDLQLGLADYFRIIEMKTAALFAAALELPAMLNEQEPHRILALRTFGLRLGSAYQIYDDCLDIVGSEATAGKSLGTDLEKGKFTLPLLLLLQQQTEESERAALHEMILDGGPSSASEIASRITSSGALTASIKTGRRFIREGVEELEKLPSNNAIEDLRSIAECVTLLLRQFDP